MECFIILDFIHVLEYLWKAAYCFHPVTSKEAEEWVQARALSGLRGHSSSVAAGMRQSATKRQLNETQRKAVDKCADYLIKYRFYLQYDCYCSNGWPIASGVIEGACRHLVKDRMDLTGARGGLKSAEAILKIRALRSSGDWEEYWRFHKRQEQQRNHFDLYDNGFLEKAAYRVELGIKGYLVLSKKSKYSSKIKQFNQLFNALVKQGLVNDIVTKYDARYGIK